MTAPLDAPPGGWWILDEPELHLGADILVPDLAAHAQNERGRAEPFEAAKLELGALWVEQAP